MSGMERKQSFIQIRENFSEKNFKEEYEASQRDVNILKTKLESATKKLDDYKFSMDQKLHLVQLQQNNEKEDFDKRIQDLVAQQKSEKEYFEAVKLEYETNAVSMENILHYQENELEKLKESLAEAEEDASQFMDQIDELKTQIDNQNKDIDTFQKENQKLYDMTVKLEEDTIKLHEALNVSEDSLALHKEKIKTTLAAALEEFKLQAIEGNQKNAEKDEMIYSLGQELEAAEAENQRLKVSLNTTHHQVSALEALLNEQEKDHLQIKTHHTSHETVVSRLHTEVENYRTQLLNKSTALVELEAKHDQLLQSTAVSTDELNKKQEMITELEAQLKEEQHKSAAERTTLSNKLFSAIDDWNDRISFVNQQIQQKDEVIAAQKKQLDSKLSELYNVRQELNKYKTGSIVSVQASPTKSTVEVSSQDTPVSSPGKEGSSWANLKNQLADYQSTQATSSPTVATQLISHNSTRDLKRSPNSTMELKRQVSRWTVNGLVTPVRVLAINADDEDVPPPPAPHYAQSKSNDVYSTPTKGANPAGSVYTAPAAPPPTAAAAPSSIGTYKEKLHKAQSMMPSSTRSASPSRVKSPERTRSTVNMNTHAFGSSIPVGDRSRSPVKLSKSANIGTDRFR